MTAARADRHSPFSVVNALYLRTKTLHVEAERSGIIRDLLRGEASREGYVLLLRNLLPAYRAMELGLARHRSSPALSALSDYQFDRAPAIESDLLELGGGRWRQEIPLLPAADLYAARIERVSEGDGSGLIAHAYTRYLGDLSGGQILQRLLARSLGLRPAQLSFYDFPRFADLDALKAAYRQALDAAGALAPDGAAIVEEGIVAFTHNIALSCAVQAWLVRGAAATTEAD
jgi:heme oxygenase